VTLQALQALAGRVANSTVPAALLLNHGSRYRELAPTEIEGFLYGMFRLSLEARVGRGRFNLVFFAIDKENDLPPWYQNPRVMEVSIPKPDHEARRLIIEGAGKGINGFLELREADPERHQGLVNGFVDQTGGLHAGEILSIAQLARADSLDFTRVSDAVRHYKLGVPDNPWAKLDPTVIEGGGEFLSRRVMGQVEAVSHSLDIIKRSIFDLSGSQFSPHAQKPKGVLFFAGPTGVGKTELAKAITELVFGSPENHTRFDMSEFNQPHSDQRLVGAPPGYVGYDVGGELTNSIRQRPFTLVLFDEIEKAHPRIMDIFLQVLDDGRLTSGRGETVYFSDAIIVFTSNLGVYSETVGGGREPLVSPDMPYGEVRARIRGAIEDFFRFTLGRPEILNRLGENIVVFDFIREKEARGIYLKMLGNVFYRLADAHKITVSMGDKSRDTLGELVTQDLSMGGRGIGNSLERLLVNPLARALHRVGARPGESFRLDIDFAGDVPNLTLDRE
jgi:ATP-dependent Clp protease ATP-binding subunit ClpA